MILMSMNERKEDFWVKMDPKLHAWLTETSVPESVKVLIKLDKDKSREPVRELLGELITGSETNIITATLTREELRQLISLNSVLYVEASRRLYLTNDE